MTRSKQNLISWIHTRALTESLVAKLGHKPNLEATTHELIHTQLKPCDIHISSPPICTNILWPTN